MAINLDTVEIFKKAFEQFKSSGNHSFSSVPPNAVIPTAPLLSPHPLLPQLPLLPPPASFSMSKILQANNEVLNKPLVEDNAQATSCDATKKELVTSSQMYGKDENLNNKDSLIVKIIIILCVNNSGIFLKNKTFQFFLKKPPKDSQISTESDQPRSSVGNAADDTFTSISSLSQSEHQYEDGEDEDGEDDYGHSEDDEDNEDETANDENLTEAEMVGRERRTRFNKSQTRVMNEKFRENPYPKEKEINQIANELNLTQRVVSVWFQNTRQKNRKQLGSLNATSNHTVDELDDSQSRASSSTTISTQSMGVSDATTAAPKHSLLMPGAMGQVSNPYQLAMSLLSAAAAQKKLLQGGAQQNSLPTLDPPNSTINSPKNSNQPKKQKKKDKEVNFFYFKDFLFKGFSNR
jgi:hypothetical protein